MSINTDITNARRVEEQFLRAQRLESIGTLAGGIAHDMNNVLAPIMLGADLLRDEVGDPDHQAILDSVASSALRGSKLIQQVLLFERGAEGQRLPIAVGDLLESTESIICETFPKTITIRVRVDDAVSDRMLVQGTGSGNGSGTVGRHPLPLQALHGTTPAPCPQNRPPAALRAQRH